MSLFLASKIKALRKIALLLIVIGLQSCAGLLEDQAPPAPQPPADEESIEENDVPLEGKAQALDEEYKPSFLKMPDYTGQKFRELTFNMHLWGKLKDKPKKLTPLVKKAGVDQPLETAIFDLLDIWKVDVAALQEIYSKQPPIPLKAEHGGFKVLFGKKIYQNEYCPIVFRKTKMTCKSEPVQAAPNGKRKIHWAKCTVSPAAKPKKDFYFGCTHFATKTQDITNNLTDFYANIRNAKKPKVVGNSKDNFILGLDSNSYMHGHLTFLWTLQHNQHVNGTPKGAPLTFAEIKPDVSQQGFTKIYKRKVAGKAVIKITGTQNKRIIDELIWRLTRDILVYDPDSKQIVPVTALKPLVMSWPDFWVNYYTISDHLPVKADFIY